MTEVKTNSMKREEIREKTMQIIFQMDAINEFDVEKLALSEANADILKTERGRQVLKAIGSHISDIDKVISENLENWKPDRLGKTDLAILRTAVCEMKYIPEIPVSVSINEAVELAKKYGDNKSYAFINSVLGRIGDEL